MSAQAVMLGPDACCDLGGLPFGLTHVSYDVSQALEDSTTGDDTSARCEQNPVRSLALTFTVQRQSDLSLHAGPQNVTAAGVAGGAGFAAVLYLNGRGDPDQVIRCPVLKARRVRGEAAVEGSPPQTATIEAESDGDFFLPGE